MDSSHSGGFWHAQEPVHNSQEPLSRPYDPLQVDASNNDMGSILSQKSVPDHLLHPCAYYLINLDRPQ